MPMIAKLTPHEARICEAYKRLGSHAAVAHELGISLKASQRGIGRARKKGWEGFMEVPIPDGYELSKTTVEYAIDQISGDPKAVREWRRLNPKAEAMTSFASALCKSVADRGWAPVRRPRKTDTRDWLADVTMFDTHIGMLADKNYTLEGDYDLEIAKKNIIAAAEDHASWLTWRGQRPWKVVLTLGGDIGHRETKDNKSLNSGHSYECHGSWIQMVDVMCEIFQEVVAIFAKVGAVVEIVVTPGNHDWHTCIWLAKMLESHYRMCNNITVNTQISPVKYVEWGINGLWFSHGNGIKDTDWQAIVSTLFPEAWARTRYRHLKLGHIHHKKKFRPLEVAEQKGLIVEYVEAMCVADAWHASHGFVGSKKGSSCFKYHKRGGLIDRHYYNSFLNELGFLDEKQENN